jgi:hypothetical protein
MRRRGREAAGDRAAAGYREAFAVSIRLLHRIFRALGVD